MTPIDALDLADFRSIDVEMRNELGLAGEFGRIAGDTIVEARAERQQAIAIVDRVVGKGGAVHAEHAHRQGMRGVDGTDSHQGGDHRNLKLSGKFAQFLRGAAVDHAAAGINHRSMRSSQRREEIGACGLGQFGCRQAVHPLPVTRNRQASRATKHALPVLHVLRHVENHGARPAGACDLECGAHRGLQFGGIGDQEDVLGHRSHDARHRRLLKRIGADCRGRHLTANHHDGH